MFFLAPELNLTRVVIASKTLNMEQDTQIQKTDAGEKTPVIAISQGDTNSISYEVIIKALADPRIFDFFTPVLYGNSKLASYHKKTLSLQNFNFNLVRNIESANAKRANIININEDEIKVDLGKETPISGEMAFISLERALQDVMNKKADILVTAPVHKNAVQLAHPDFKGHTEYLQARFNANNILMIMAGRIMKIALATTHVPIAEVSQNIKKESLLTKIYLFNQSLIQDFNITQPRIAVLGLNPHAGDNGMFGNEEIEEIIPAIELLNSQGIAAFGPFPADGFFGNMTFREFDGVFAMYHDQALIPFKTICFEDGVNFTAGLPIVRTSPAHGTAFDIAGQDKASAEPMKQALLLAAEIFDNRKKYAEMYENQLKLSMKNLQ
jgi:4-hydroxythreonine-4-phosphate dehydrogenase